MRFGNLKGKWSDNDAEFMDEILNSSRNGGFCLLKTNKTSN